MSNSIIFTNLAVHGSGQLSHESVLSETPIWKMRTMLSEDSNAYTCIVENPIAQLSEDFIVDCKKFIRSSKLDRVGYVEFTFEVGGIVHEFQYDFEDLTSVTTPPLTEIFHHFIKFNEIAIDAEFTMNSIYVCFD